jgi:hypothetical protein
MMSYKFPFTLHSKAIVLSSRFLKQLPGGLEQTRFRNKDANRFVERGGGGEHSGDQPEMNQNKEGTYEKLHICFR